MTDTASIKYLPQNEIDKEKWDHCIQSADNSRIYAFSYYLDTMSTHWDALVLHDDKDNYQAVFPLTHNKKYGVYYLYQPFITAQLGLFGKNLDATLLKSFLNAIPRKFRYWDIYLNQGNLFSIDGYPLYERVNYVLDLSLNYAALYEQYRDNIRRNCKKAIQAGCTVQRGFDAELVIELATLQMQRFPAAIKDNIERFKKLYSHLHALEKAITYGIFSPAGQLLASCIFFFSEKRAYYILVGNHPNGKTLGASHALIDAFIKDHAGQDMILDFEGSDIRNLAFFYSSFGAVEEKYAALRVNRLPLLLRWLKK